MERRNICSDKALAADSGSPAALDLKGVIAARKQDYAGAEMFFLKAIEADKGYGKAYANLGALKWEAGKREEAFIPIERGFILSPSDEAIIEQYREAATVLSHFERAEQFMEEAVGLYPFHKGLKYAFSDLLLKQGKHGKAMEILEDTLLMCGIDDETLASALKLRDTIGPKGAEPLGRSSISLCMIVKNEENNIGQCLKKISRVVDEMIVVDTGSSDRTKDIARAFGARVFDFPWNGNFSDARNFSLSRASGAWIFVLDADEVISRKDHEVSEAVGACAKFRGQKKGAGKGTGHLLFCDTDIY